MNLPKEPEHGEKIEIFDKTYKYLGKSFNTVDAENVETGEIHTFGFWEFVEGTAERY